MSIFVTFKSKSIICPKWNIKVSIEGKYGFFDNDNPHIAKYINCKCPIMEEIKNRKKPKSKNYPLIILPCGMERKCLGNVSFDTYIDAYKG